jgi:hypothetical protein
MRKLVVLLPVLVALAGGCDATRRDYGVCDHHYYDCGKGFTCDFTVGLCVAEKNDASVGPDVYEPDTGPGPDAETPDLAIEDAPAPVDMEADANEPIDASIVDAPEPVDGPAPDTRVPDAAGSCSVDNDCLGVPGGAFCVGSRCVACTKSTQCNNDAGTPFCSVQNTCVSCSSSTGNDGGVCLGANPVCNPQSGACVECLRNNDCLSPGKSFCVQNKCVGCDFPGAIGTSSDAGVDGGTADGGASTAACSGSKPACVPSSSSNPLAGQCVQCTSSSECSGSTPVCNSSNVCVPCSKDSECTSGPGICMLVPTGTFQQDGRCATDAETIYVQNSSGCTGGAGTKASPYCQPQSAISAVTTSKRVILMSGTAALAVWTASFGSGSLPVYVMGRNNPTISVGAADIGVHIFSGKVYIRGLTVQGVGNAAVNPGIVAEAGAEVGLDRCTVTGNAGGLLVADGAGFDVANSLFVRNEPGGMGAAVFGGAYLGNPGTGMSHRFWFNTVADNQAIGMACTNKTQTLDGCLLSGDSGGEVANCTLSATTKSPNRSPTGVPGTGFLTDSSPPLFSTSKPYHLTSGISKSTTSPCKDYITDTSIPFPPDDIDGEERPNGAAIDCGADEYWP